MLDQQIRDEEEEEQDRRAVLVRNLIGASVTLAPR
jgi:hypothetical protein